MSESPSSLIWKYLRKHPLGTAIGIITSAVIGFCAAFNTLSDFRRNLVSYESPKELLTSATPATVAMIPTLTPSPTPTAPPSPPPTPTETPAPTSTPAPEPSPKPTATPIPVDAPDNGLVRLYLHSGRTVWEKYGPHGRRTEDPPPELIVEETKLGLGSHVGLDVNWIVLLDSKTRLIDAGALKYRLSGNSRGDRPVPIAVNVTEKEMANFAVVETENRVRVKGEISRIDDGITIVDPTFSRP